MADGAQDLTRGTFNENNAPVPTTDKVFELFSLKGRTAIVAGSAAGIGLAVAHALAEAGANVAMWYNSNDAAITRAEEIAKEYGVKCKAYQVDITDYAAVQSGIDATLSDPAFNARIDVFVANAGIPWAKGPILDGDIERFRKVVATDLDGVFYCAKAVGPVFRRQALERKDHLGNEIRNFLMGSFITTASMSGHIANIPQLQAPYNACKAGVIHLMRSLAVEWVRFARCNSVSPGYIKTDIASFVSKETKAIWAEKVPMGRQAETFELKGAFLYLASDAASYTTGADIIVDGGYCVP